MRLDVCGGKNTHVVPIEKPSILLDIFYAIETMQYLTQTAPS